MTDTYGGPNGSDDIINGDDTPSARLQEDADAILAAQPHYGASARELGSIRRAMRQDAHDGRVWATDRAGRVVEVLREEPLKASVYALLAGLFLGMLLRR